MFIFVIFCGSLSYRETHTQTHTHAHTHTPARWQNRVLQTRPKSTLGSRFVIWCAMKWKCAFHMRKTKDYQGAKSQKNNFFGKIGNSRNTTLFTKTTPELSPLLWRRWVRFTFELFSKPVEMCLNYFKATYWLSQYFRWSIYSHASKHADTNAKNTLTVLGYAIVCSFGTRRP